MAKGDPLDEAHHLARYVKASLVVKDDNLNAIGIFPQAFELREGEPYLSGSWVEYFAGTRKSQMKSVLTNFGLKTTQKAAFAVLNVGKVHEVCQSRGKRVRIIHEPMGVNPAHVAVRQMVKDDATLLGLLADLATSDFVLVSNI